jgi:hypothetical protein
VDNAGSKTIIPVTKAINAESVADLTLPYAGYKTNLEVAYVGDLYLAFRCTETLSSACAALPYE